MRIYIPRPGTPEARAYAAAWKAEEAARQARWQAKKAKIITALGWYALGGLSATVALLFLVGGVP